MISCPLSYTEQYLEYYTLCHKLKLSNNTLPFPSLAVRNMKLHYGGKILLYYFIIEDLKFSQVLCRLSTKYYYQYNGVWQY